MFDRISAKEKAKTLLRERSLADAAGYAALLLVSAGGSALGLVMLAVLLGIAASTTIGSAAWGGFSALVGYGGGGNITATISAIGAYLIGYIVGLMIVPVGIFLLFHAGMIRSALRYSRGDKQVRVVDVLLAGDRLGKYVRIVLWQALFLFLWILPSSAAAMIGLLCLPSGIIWLAVIGIIFLIAAVGWAAYITVRKVCQYFFSFHVAEDRRDLPALDCIRESTSLTMGYKGKLFVTMLTFLGWDVVGWSLVGSVFVTPYKYLTYASIYEQLAGSFHPADRGQMLWLNNKPAPGKQPEGERALRAGAVEILSGELAGSRFTLNAGEEIAVGRDPKQANVVASSDSISGLHCKIRYDAHTGAYIVTDHSINGTFINNEKLASGRGVYAKRGSIVKLADGAMLIRLS